MNKIKRIQKEYKDLRLNPIDNIVIIIVENIKLLFLGFTFFKLKINILIFFNKLRKINIKRKTPNKPLLL